VLRTTYPTAVCEGRRAGRSMQRARDDPHPGPIVGAQVTVGEE
jgi:hypothetical protein